MSKISLLMICEIFSVSKIFYKSATKCREKRNQNTPVFYIIHVVFPRDVTRSATYIIVRCMSVRLSRSYIVSRQLYISSDVFTVGKPRHCSFFRTKPYNNIPAMVKVGYKQVALLSQRGRAMLRVCQ